MPDTEAADWRNLSDGERMISGLGGAVLLGLGLTRRPSLAATFLAIGGLMLIGRGISGNCLIYRAFGLDSRNPPGNRRGGDDRVLDEIERAARDSFPASDAPSWSPHTIGSPAMVE